MNNGFIDLRSNAHGKNGQADDSVWPSFTDIMSVVVMIFLMSLVVILLRNIKLVDEIKVSIDQRDKAAQLAEINAEENLTLEQRLSELEQRIIQAQLLLSTKTSQYQESQQQLKQTEAALEQERNSAQKLTADIQALEVIRQQLLKNNEDLAIQKLTSQGLLKEVTEELSSVQQSSQTLETKKNELELEQYQLQLQLKALQSELDQSTDIAAQKDSLITSKNNEINAVNIAFATLEKDKTSVDDRLSQAQQQINSIEDQLNQNIQQLDIKTTELTVVKTELDSLQQKYLELVGPARSELDKYVVNVEYSKSAGNEIYKIRRPDESSYRSVSNAQLNKELDELKNEHNESLYVKVVIPSGSGLSHDDTWLFTNEILQKYDYYYQK